MNSDTTEGSNYIKEIIKNAFGSYWRKCNESDFILPLSGKCYNESGMMLTGIESLETLWLTGLTNEYKNMRDKISKSVVCDKSKYYVVNDVAVRVIGSLLSIFGMTNDKMYFNKAMECGEVLLDAFKNDIGYPIISNQIPKSYPWMDGIIISESSGFITEFILLSLISKNNKFKNIALKYLKCLENIITKFKNIPYVLSTENCAIIGNSFGFNIYTASFVSDIIRTHIIYPSSSSYNILKTIFETLDKILKNKDEFDTSFCKIRYLIHDLKDRDLYDLLVKFYDKTGKYCDGSIKDNLPMNSGYFNFDNFLIKDDGFNFDSNQLIEDLYDGKNFNNLSFINKLNYTQCGNLQCSLLKQNPLIFEDFMPPESISKWFKFLYILNNSIEIEKYIVNNAGHLLPKFYK